MKDCCCRVLTVSICFGLFVFLIGQQQVLGQEEKPLNLDDIRKTLVFRSRISVTTEELNEQLISEIRKRKVNFILTSEEEESLKKAGGSDLLIKAICENLPKKLEAQIILYKKYTDNYNGTLKQQKIALEAAKEFVEKYRDDEYVKEIIDYLEKTIPILEKHIKANDEVCKF